VQIFTELDTYRRWGVAPRPENVAAKGSGRHYKKKAEDFEAFRLNRPTWINSACCRSENRLQQLLVGQQLAWRPGSSPDSKRVKNNI